MLDRDRLLELLQSQYHKPYKLRPWTLADIYSLDPKNFDCSSLVMWTYFRLGFKVPRVSLLQHRYCEKVEYNNVRPGDLFFLSRTGKPMAINHVGLYIGGGLCMEAAGGRAGKVIRTFTDKNIRKRTFVSWGRVPLARAEDDFFKWVAKYPKPKTAKEGKEQIS